MKSGEREERDTGGERRDVNTREMRNENAEGELRKHIILLLMFI